VTDTATKSNGQPSYSVDPDELLCDETLSHRLTSCNLTGFCRGHSRDMSRSGIHIERDLSMT